MQSLTVPNITNIQPKAFYKCYNLSSVTFQPGLKSISDRMFQSCIELKEVSWPDGLQEIGHGAFFGTSLNNISLPSSVTIVYDLAFSFNMFLKEVFISSPFIILSTKIFCGDISLQTVTLLSKSIENPITFLQCTRKREKPSPLLALLRPALSVAILGFERALYDTVRLRQNAFFRYFCFQIPD